jgi:hypothetical protein
MSLSNHFAVQCHGGYAPRILTNTKPKFHGSKISLLLTCFEYNVAAALGRSTVDTFI